MLQTPYRRYYFHIYIKFDKCCVIVDIVFHAIIKENLIAFQYICLYIIYNIISFTLVIVLKLI